MAKIFVLDVDAPTTKLRGKLQRFLLEIRPGTFVGKMSGKDIGQIWESVCENSKSAIGIATVNNESGFRIATHGENRRSVVDNYGVSLVIYKKQKKKEKNTKTLVKNHDAVTT